MEPGLGGGPISESASGDMDSVLESSRLWVAGKPPEGDCDELADFCASSIISRTSIEGITADKVDFRLVLGFTIGDCRTRLDDRCVLFLPLRSLRLASGCAIGDVCTISMLMSTAKASVGVPDGLNWPIWYCIC